MVGLTGLQNAGGGSIAVNNAIGNTPFLGGPGSGAAQGTGVGSLGNFGGYFPTPLPQFNNYPDYLTAMGKPAQMMDALAGIPLMPGYFDYNTQSAEGFAQDVFNSPFWSEAMTGAKQAGGLAAGLYYDAQGNPLPPSGTQGFIYQDWFPAAQKMYGYGNQLSGQANKLFDLEDPIRQAAFDPQFALEGRTRQQLTDQTRAGLAARGLLTDPYGAGVESTALSNFDIDWQNNLLQRMSQGAGDIGQLATQGGQLLQGAGALDTAAAQLQDMGVNEIAALSRMPGDIYNEMLDRDKSTLQWLGEYGQEASMPFQRVFQNWQDIENQFLAANQQGFNQNQISGFEDPFSLLQLQTQVEMEREQMQQQEEMQKKQQAMQGAGMGMSALGGMKGGI